VSDPISRLNAALAGRYRLERTLGEGGMATVYQAEDLRHGRRVALKVLKPELAAVVGAERFLAEIRTTASLQHPHILPLFDSGEADGLLYYVMPSVEGESLRDRLDRERQLPVEEAVRIATSVAEALEYAHERGVIHRDIKPANILLQAGKPVISDFGIALAVNAAGGGRLTETGLSLGTPHYMSPEQATGDANVGTATDIWALACVLHELLVGEPPYTGSTPQAVLGRIVTAEPPSAAAERKSVPAHVDAAIRRALEKVPADRFATAGDFAQALADPRFRHGDQGAAASWTGAAGPWNRLAIAATGVAATLAVALGVSLRRPETPAQLVRFVVPSPEGIPLGGPCCGVPLALSPDGEWVALVSAGGLYLRRLGRLEVEVLPGTAGAALPFFSPDGRWLGYYQYGRLRRVPMTGGPSVDIVDAPSLRGASWGDNDVIVFAEYLSGALYTVPASGGAPTPVPRTEGVTFHHPWMLPGGESALVTLPAVEPRNTRLAVVDLRTGVTDTLGVGTYAAYASGWIVFSAADGALMAQPFDPASRRTTGEAVTFDFAVAVTGPGVGAFTISGKGLVYQSSGAGQSLIISGPAGAAPVPLPQRGDIEDPTFSPDGRRIAFRLANVDQGQLWIWDRDQSTLERLTTDDSMNFDPVWTPDGSRIAFARRVAGASRLHWQPADGSGPAELLLATPNARPGSWSPDGRTLAFYAPRGGSVDIGLLDIGDAEPRWVVEGPANEIQPQISPDGHWLAYTSNRSGQTEVYVQSLNGVGGRVQVSADGGNSPRWAGDGNTLYYARGTLAVSTLIAATFTTQGGFRVVSRAERLDVQDVGLNALGTINYDVSPDGQEFVHIDLAGGRDLVWILDWPELLRDATGAR
jgi:serine/threonine-protein kinase